MPMGQEGRCSGDVGEIGGARLRPHGPGALARTLTLTLTLALTLALALALALSLLPGAPGARRARRSLGRPGGGQPAPLRLQHVARAGEI